MKTNPTRNVEAATINLLNLSDELPRVDAYYECAYLAVNDACTRESANAIQSVMLVAQDKLREIIASVEAERERQNRIEEAEQKKKAA